MELHVLPLLDRHVDHRNPDNSRGFRRERLRLLHHAIHGGELCHPNRLHLHLQGDKRILL